MEDKNTNLLKNILLEIDEDIPAGKLPGVMDPKIAEIRKLIDEKLPEVHQTRSLFFPLATTFKDAEGSVSLQQYFDDPSMDIAKALTKMRNIASDLVKSYEGKGQKVSYQVRQDASKKNPDIQGIRIWRVEPRKKTADDKGDKPNKATTE